MTNIENEEHQKFLKFCGMHLALIEKLNTEGRTKSVYERARMSHVIALGFSTISVQWESFPKKFKASVEPFLKDKFKRQKDKEEESLLEIFKSYAQDYFTLAIDGGYKPQDIMETTK